MRTNTACILAVSVVCSGCSGEPKAADTPKAKGTPKTAETLKSPQGIVYTVSRVPEIKKADLPTNSDLKMADGDLAKYAVTACTLDVPPTTAPTRCDVYVQPDPSGTLIGYAAVIQDAKGVRFETITTLNEKKQPGGENCSISGTLAGTGENYNKSIKDAAKDFEGQFMYSAWQKEPGNYLISPTDADGAVDTSPDAALGMWYVSKVGDKLRISQERWNYCYKDSSVNVDDVFYRAISLVKKI